MRDRAAALLTRRNPMPASIQASNACQAGILRHLLLNLGPLPVGRAFGVDQLGPDATAAAFRAQVPVTRYADYEALFARVARGEADVLFPGVAAALAQTSGTTSSAAAGERFIPQSEGLLEHHLAGGSESLARLLSASGLRLMAGKLMMLGGSTGLTPNPQGVPFGDLSGIIADRVPIWLRPWHEPGGGIAFEANWPRKLARITARCARQDIRLVSGIPAWMLMLFAHLEAARGLPLHQLWPGLRGCIHGGHAIEPFITRLQSHLRPETMMVEVYPASEAFIAVGRPWRLGDAAPAALDLLTNHGVFLEFLPEGAPDDTAVGAGELAPGQVYRVLLTTPAGLLRYELGDLVRAEGPGQVRFAGRIKTRISVFGEHVEGHCLAEALAGACTDTGATVANYHVAPVLPGPQDARGRHEWWVEFAHGPTDPAAFTSAIDTRLKLAVMDYAAHRDGGQLLAPSLVDLPPGTFDRYLAAKGKLGGQHKIPQAWPDRTIADDLALHLRTIA